MKRTKSNVDSFSEAIGWKNSKITIVRPTGRRQWLTVHTQVAVECIFKSLQRNDWEVQEVSKVFEEWPDYCKLWVLSCPSSFIGQIICFLIFGLHIAACIRRHFGPQHARPKPKMRRQRPGSKARARSCVTRRLSLSWKHCTTFSDRKDLWDSVRLMWL